MILYPKLYVKDASEIPLNFFKENEIKGIILDVDNTLIDYDKKMPERVKNWVLNLKKSGMKFCILSNSNNEEKVKKVANILQVPFFYFAKKPLKSGFKKAKEQLEVEYNAKLENKNIAVIGDQIATDIVGANRCKMVAVLVEPLDKKDIFITKIKRPIENLVIKQYRKFSN